MTTPPGTAPSGRLDPGGRLESAPPWRSSRGRESTPERVAGLDRWRRANLGALMSRDHGPDATLPLARDGRKPTGEARRNSRRSRAGHGAFSLYPDQAGGVPRVAFPRRVVTIDGVDLRVSEWVADRDPVRNRGVWARRDVRDPLAVWAWRADETPGGGGPFCSRCGPVHLRRECRRQRGRALRQVGRRRRRHCDCGNAEG